MSFRSRLRPAKRITARVLEGLWSVVFWVAGSVARHRCNRWSSSGGEVILVVAPHPDDEAIGCVGTLLLHRDAGDSVCVAVATDGRRSRVIADPAAMSAQRRREATEAARLMGIDQLEWIGLPEGEWNVASLREALISLLAKTDPDIIYAPSRIDFHPEHWNVAHALALALADPRTLRMRDRRLRVYQVQVPLTPSVSNVVADISAFSSRCEQVLRAYRSQSGTMPGTFRQRRYSARLHGITGRAEVFWEISVGRYVALHGSSPAHWPMAFRGVRGFPLTDPLAYLVGLRERRKIKAVQPPATDQAGSVPARL
jgi:LmbE family N-acetylglucosaminyl deacetylase